MNVHKSTITMTNAEREMLRAPSTTDGMNIRRANPTCLNLDVDVIITKRFWLELIFVELGPRLRPIDLESGECFWIAHSEIMKSN
jgi:hypothetical protein